MQINGASQQKNHSSTKADKMKKTCRKCKVEKEATEKNFHKYSRLRDGLKNECKDCVRKYNKEKGRSDEWLRVIIG